MVESRLNDISFPLLDIAGAKSSHLVAGSTRWLTLLVGANTHLIMSVKVLGQAWAHRVLACLPIETLIA